MANWLPKDWEVKDAEEKAARALAAVRVREARRRRAVKAAGAAAAFAACALILTLLFLPGLLKRGRTAPGGPLSLQASRAQAPPVARPAAPAPAPAGEEARAAAPSRPSPRPPRPAPPSSASGAGSSPPPAEVTPRLRKVGGAVVVTWSGDPQGEYVVYKCESPAFDACSRKAEVKGTSWSDGEMDKSPVVFYKVERKA